MRNVYRTPSPDKAESEGNRRHSPWTAQRVRKKGRSSGDVNLNGVLGQLTGEDDLSGRRYVEGKENIDAMALHLAQNPFLVSHGVLLHSGGDNLVDERQLTVSQDLILATKMTPREGAASEVLSSTLISDSAISKPKALPSSCSMPLFCTHAGQTEVVSDDAGLSGELRQAEDLASSSGDLHGQSPLQKTSHDFKIDSGVDNRSSSFMDQLQPPKAEMASIEAECREAASDGYRDRALLQDNSPIQAFRPLSVAPTPSPGVPAPGLRFDGQGRAPPRVPTSCRTVRRVLINSPKSSQERRWSADGSIAQMSIDRQIYNSQQRSSQTGSAKGQTARLGSCSSDQFYDYGFNLTWMEATPESVEESEDEAMRRNDSHSPLDDESPTFVLSRGHVTPNNLLPGWDDEDEGPWGPRKEYCPQTRRRSGQLATFDERLQEAIQNGDAVSLGQAWRDVKCGDVKPDDIDTLNTLLKCYCKVEGDPKEAEDIVKEACKNGRILPNASTYHHMTTLWTRHEQLNNTH